MARFLVAVNDFNIAEYLKNQNIVSEQDIINYMFSLSGENYRHVKNRQTIKVKLADNNYFIKKHYPLSLLDRLLDIFRFKSYDSAWNEVQAISAVKLLKINTLDVIAYGLNKNNIINNSSFILTKAIEPNLNLDTFCEALIKTKFYYKLKRVLIKYIAQTTRELHLQGLNHRDYYLCHYLLNFSQLDINRIKDILSDNVSNISEATTLAMEQQLTSCLYLIDLHRMQIRHKVPNRYLIKDLSAMLFSVRNLKFTKTDYIRFLKIYFNINNKKNARRFYYEQNNFLRKIINKASGMREKG